MQDFSIAADGSIPTHSGLCSTIFCCRRAANVGMTDYQTGVPGRGDAKVIPGMWYSIELQATTPVAEWGGQPVRMAQEEDVIIDAAGKVRWALKRQDRLFLIK